MTLNKTFHQDERLGIVRLSTPMYDSEIHNLVSKLKLPENEVICLNKHGEDRIGREMYNGFELNPRYGKRVESVLKDAGFRNYREIMTPPSLTDDIKQNIKSISTANVASALNAGVLASIFTYLGKEIKGY